MKIYSHTILRAFVLAAVFSGGVFLSGCATRSPAPSLYDLGPLPSSPPGGADLSGLPPIHVTEVAAADWLNSQMMYYRLAYANTQQALPYAHSRWMMPPAQLFAQRLRARLAQGGAQVVVSRDDAANLALLRLEIDDFMQIFDGPEQSHASVSVRASVFRARQVIAQRTFVRQIAAAKPDAAGGVRALADASDALMIEFVAWLAGLPLKK